MKQKKGNIFSNKSYETNRSMKDNSAITKLVGYKCVIQSFINNNNVPVPWI